jgi:hypothetical protein
MSKDWNIERVEKLTLGSRHSTICTAKIPPLTGANPENSRTREAVGSRLFDPHKLGLLRARHPKIVARRVNRLP